MLQQGVGAGGESIVRHWPTPASLNTAAVRERGGAGTRRCEQARATMLTVWGRCSWRASVARAAAGGRRGRREHRAALAVTGMPQYRGPAVPTMLTLWVRCSWRASVARAAARG